MPKLGRRRDMSAYDDKPEALSTSAPFGNTFTPVVRTKIIAGKPVYVLERNKEDDSSLKPAGSPSEGDSEKKAPWEQAHKVLPPISPRATPSENLHHQGSGESSAAPSAQFNPELGRVAAANLTTFQQRDMQPRLPQYEHGTKAAVTSYGGRLPEGRGSAYLPTYPITLERKEELRLLSRLKESMKGYEMIGLRDIYTELTSFDSELTSWVNLSDFIFTLLRFKLYLDDEDVHLAASMFVSREHPGKVNYEKLLSYIASAMRHEEHDEPASSVSSSRAESSKYFQSKAYNNSIYSEPSPLSQTSGAKGKLMQLVEDQLLNAEGDFDLNKLHQELSLADRLHRQALSHQEIKEICYRLRLPLQESIINLILQRCRSLGDGQYSWEDFYKFLEGVCPVQTGLVIPRSKRPLEMARVPAQPKSNWPKAEIESSFRSSISPQQMTPLKPDPPTTIPVTHSKLLSDEKTINKFGNSNSDEPWFQKFSKLAEALYRNDSDKTGDLALSEATWLVGEYNTIFKLAIPESVIGEAISKNTQNNRSDIDGLLKSLLAATNY